MANNNDLRFIKTERLIEDTYIELKKKKNAPVKVCDLCNAALINKTTFYSHYESIGSLHEHMCDKTVTEILATCPHVGDAFTNTQAFVCSLIEALQQNEIIIKTLYGDDSTMLVNNLEKGLLSIYLQGDELPENEMQIIFAIGGASRLLIKNQKKDRVRITISLLQKLF